MPDPTPPPPPLRSAGAARPRRAVAAPAAIDAPELWRHRRNAPDHAATAGNLGPGPVQIPAPTLLLIITRSLLRHYYVIITPLLLHY